MRLLCINSSVGDEPNVYEGEEYHANDVVDFQYIEKKYGPFCLERFPLKWRNGLYYNLEGMPPHCFFHEELFAELPDGFIKEQKAEAHRREREIQTAEC